MPKYNVHIFAVVRVKFKDIEADSQEQAIKIASKDADFHQMFDKYLEPAGVFDAPEIEYAEEEAYYLVDEAGDEEYEKSRWHDGAFKVGKTYLKDVLKIES